MRPRIDAVHPVLGSRDVAASIDFYEQLGFVRTFADDAGNPRYAAVVRDGVELHLQWHDAKEWAHTGDRPTYRFVVADVDGLYREFREAGVLDNIKPVSDTSWGTREFHVEIPTGTGCSSIGLCSAWRCSEASKDVFPVTAYAVPESS